MAGKKTGKRLLTWVLVLVMALSLLPLNVLAAEADEAAALQMSDEDNSDDRSLMPAKGKTYTITFDANGGKLSNGKAKFDVTYDSKSNPLDSHDAASNNILKEAPTYPAHKFLNWYYVGGLTGIHYPVNSNTKIREVLKLSSNNTVYAKWGLADGFEKASIFYLKDPTKNRDSNTGEDWNGPLGGKEAGFVDTTGFNWEKSPTDSSVYNSKNVKPDDVTWPTGFGTTNAGGLELNKNTDEWNAIFEAFKTKVEADNGVGSLTKDDVDSITLVPYKVSRGNQTDGSYHVDCDVVIKCNFVTVDFVVKNDSNVFASILNGKMTCPKGQAFPKDNVPAAPEKDGYEFDGWYTNEECKEKADFDKPLTKDTTFYGKYTEKETPAPEPDDPELGKNFDFSEKTMVVKFTCETTVDHNESYGLKNGYYSVSNKKKNDYGKWRCAIEIDLNKYFADCYSTDHTGHTRTYPEGEISRVVYYLDWNENVGKWTASESLISATEIHVKCDAVTPPTEPSKEDIKELLGSNAVQIICTNNESGHGSKTFGLIDDTFSIVHRGYNCEVKIDSFNEYVEKFNTDLGVAHISDASKTSEEKSIVNLKWEDGKWTVMDAPAKHYVLCETPKYTVTYTDGVDGEEVFADQVHNDLLSGTATPTFNGTPTRDGYVFVGWNPAVAEKVTENATYAAQWKEDKNNNGIPDENEDKYTVTYTDGVNNEEVFADQVYGNLLSGTTTPAFNGTPTRTDYVFAGWKPEVAEKVTENATYAAQWKEDKNNNGIPDENEDKYTVTYTDGVNNEEVFADQVYGNLLSGTTTPAFNGTPTRDGYRFAGWNPAVADNVTESVTYAAQWTPRTDLSYTVHYYLKNTTKQVADDKTVNGQTFNADVTEKAIRISGYRVYGDSVKSITIGTGTNEIIFYYTRASRPSASSTSKPTLNTGDHYAYVMGYPDGTVRPNGSITRAEVSTILFRLLSDKTRDEYFTTESSFTDVKAGAWYNNSIATLEKAGVIVDTAKGGAFRPNEAITRAELAAMLAQFSDAKPVKGVKFSDVSAEHWAYEAIAIAAKMGWIEGYPDGTFRPDATITRAEMMTLVNRALERVPSDEDHLLSKRVMLTFPDCKSGDWFYIAVQEATNSHTYERAATEKNGDEQWTALRANRDWTLLEK